MNKPIIITALAAVVSLTSCGSKKEAAEAQPHKFGYQLYTVRDDIANDGLAQTLNKTHEMGYELMESFGYFGGQFFGLETKAFGEEVENAHLSSPSGHYMPPQLMDTVVGPIDTGTIPQFLDAAQALGQHWVVIPWMTEAWRTPEGYDHLTTYMLQLGEAAKERGMRAAYHNHDFEFLPMDPNDPNSPKPYQILLENLPADLIDFEMDIHWVAFAGEDPVEWLTSFPGRFPLWHVKDFQEDRTQVPVGQGVIRWADVFSTADLAGLKYYFIEQDVCAADQAVDCLKESIDWAKTQPYMN